MADSLMSACRHIDVSGQGREVSTSELHMCTLVLRSAGGLVQGNSRGQGLCCTSCVCMGGALGSPGWRQSGLRCVGWHLTHSMQLAKMGTAGSRLSPAG
jgi:hypothetical protein